MTRIAATSVQMPLPLRPPTNAQRSAGSTPLFSEPSSLLFLCVSAKPAAAQHFLHRLTRVATEGRFLQSHTAFVIILDGDGGKHLDTHQWAESVGRQCQDSKLMKTTGNKVRSIFFLQCGRCGPGVGGSWICAGIQEPSFKNTTDLGSSGRTTPYKVLTFICCGLLFFLSRGFLVF